MPLGNGYYIGTVNEANEPEGIGAYCYESGVTCGYYHNGKRNGKFVSIGENGYLAMTECVNDSMNGWGWVKCGGITWAGEFKNDEINGVAYESYYGKDGEYIHSYVGDFVDGRYDGVGRHIGASGSLYEGDFVSGKKSGLGVWETSNSRYEGSFLDDKMYGYGSFRMENAEFVGIWNGFDADCFCYDENNGGMITKYGFTIWEPNEGVPGHLSREGGFEPDPSVANYVRYRNTEYVEISSIPQEVMDAVKDKKNVLVRGTYYGYFNDNGVPNGYGDVSYTDISIGLNEGDISDAYIQQYKGYWKNGLKNGEGMMKYANGDEYEGLWKNDKKEGPGKMTFANGDVFEGMWKNDMMHGDSCTFTSHEGWTKTGRWANGEYLGSYEELNKEYEELLST